MKYWSTHVSTGGGQISDIYPKELTISKITESAPVASYLSLLFTRDENNNITTKLYDKSDVLHGFQTFPLFMLSNIPCAPANRVLMPLNYVHDNCGETERGYTRSKG